MRWCCRSCSRRKTPRGLKRPRAIIDTLPEGLPEVSARLAALLLPLGEQGTRKALKQLRCSNALIEEVTTLVREAGWFRKKKRLPGRSRPDACWAGWSQIPSAVCWLSARPTGRNRRLPLRPCQTAAGRLQAENACCPGGAIGRQWPGPDGAGRKAGPGLRGQLEALLEAVITGQLPNERKALLAAVKIELDP